jgi:hypothetical protein
MKQRPYSVAITAEDSVLSGEIYRQLRLTLVERGSSTLLGALVQISPDHTAPFTNQNFYSFTYNANEAGAREVIQNKFASERRGFIEHTRFAMHRIRAFV